MSCFATHSHTKVVADYLIGYLIHYLRDNRIDLTRHNGRPRLHGRKIDFSQSATRTGCKQTKVIAYLVHLHRNSSHSRGVAYKARGIRSSSHQVTGQFHVPSGKLRQSLHAFLRIFRFCRNTRADGGSSHIDRKEFLRRKVQVLYLIAQNAGKSVECLSESHGHSIFQLRTSHFNDVFKRFGFALERIDQLLKMFHKFKVSIIHSYMYGGRISVIGGLRAIDVIVR